MPEDIMIISKMTVDKFPHAKKTIEKMTVDNTKVDKTIIKITRQNDYR